MLRRTDPDEAFVINGVSVTGRELAEARQQLAHEGAHLDRWDELGDHDQEMAALDAGNYLRALARLLPAGSTERPAEIENMRAVVESARVWRRSGGTANEHRRATAVLIAAVDAYETVVS